MDTAGTQIRVLVLDDDPVFRRILVHAFEAIAHARVVAAVGSVAEAQRHVETASVDLVTLDVVLKTGSGLDLLPWLAKNHPKVVTLIMTAGGDRRASQTIDAVLLGASSLVLKPSGPQAPQLLRQALGRVVDGLRPPTKVVAPPPQHFPQVYRLPREVIAVGASTGGPAVVLQFLQALPTALEVPILVTQHMAAEHMASYANMLGYTGGRPVHLAKHGEWVLPDHVYLACDNRHLTLIRQEGRLCIVQNEGPEENFCRPAVDPMFRSVAQVCGDKSVAVVMTGMGTDGAKGGLALRSLGAPVIVQDQASSVVWGMPGATVALGAASEVVPGPLLAEAVQKVVGGWASQGPEGHR